MIQVENEKRPEINGFRAYLETAFVITPRKNKSFVQVITLGVNGAFYPKQLPIMADQKAYPWQVSLFAGLAIGKRWK